jgi:hypothetical protein
LTFIYTIPVKICQLKSIFTGVSQKNISIKRTVPALFLCRAHDAATSGPCPWNENVPINLGDYF